jgi:hypothetical protein
MAFIDVTPGLAPLWWVPALPGVVRGVVWAVAGGASAVLLHGARRRARSRS